MLVLITAQEGEWDDIHLAVRQFQRVNMAIKYAPRPVVAAPQGMALGGGCEISLHAARIHAAAEAYIGLVETGVGLIPGGGGTKEMLIRANEHAAGGEDLDLFHALKPVFENIAMAKVSTSAEEARALGYLRRRGFGRHESRPAGGGRQGRRRWRWCARGIIRRRRRKSACWARNFWRRAKLAIHMMMRGGYATEYDGVGGAQARVRSGGRSDHGAADRAGAIRAGSGARSFCKPVRRTQDAGADRAYAEDREAIAQLIFREINADWRTLQNFPSRAVLIINGETYLRRIVSKPENFAYFHEPGWRVNEVSLNKCVELFLRFPRNRISALRLADAGDPDSADQRGKPTMSNLAFN